MKAVLVGGAGFIGTHLARALAEGGHHVTVYDRRLPPPALQRPGVCYVSGDAFAPRAPGLLEVLRGAHCVYHLAWSSLPADSNLNMISDVQDNLQGSLRLLAACVDAGVRRVVFFSSGGTVYGPAQILPIPESHPTEPLSAHAIDKLAVEKFLAVFHRLYGLDYVILRPGNPFGEYQNPRGRQGVIAVFLNRVATGEPLEVWGDGSVIRDYFYVGDLARAAVLAGETPRSCTVYNIGSGVGRSLHDVIAAIFRLVGRTVPIRWLPARAIDVPVNVLDISKARHGLGWTPQVSFEEGLRRTWLALQEGARG